jgi:glutaredoxin
MPDEQAGEKKTIRIKMPIIKLPKISMWFATTVILGIALVIVLATGFSLTGKVALAGSLTPEEAAKKAVDWITNYFKSNSADVTVELVSASETSSGVYQFTVKLTGSSGSQQETYYVSKDGELFFPQGISTKITQTTATTPQAPSVPKTDKPDVKLFVMSYCPYGLQAEKAILPVMKLLGNKADITINFVDYIMHGEKEVYENLRQYCIQKEQRNKFYDYLLCFVQSDDYKKCLSEAGVDEGKLETCMDDTDKAYNITNLLNDKSTWLNGYYPQFPIESDLNDLYGVRGSPTIVINGQQVSVSRSPEAYKQAVCNAFNNPPSECSTTLSTQQTSPGIGPLNSTSSSSSGSCG